jgi:PPOX class probable F420-dependent enzyme
MRSLLMLGGVEARTLEELPGWARSLVTDARVARLALLDGADRPRVLPVTYAVHAAALWSAIDRKPKRSPEPARVRYLRRRPEAAVLVDRYSDDWTELAWVQVLGSVEVVRAADEPEALEALTKKYEPYRVEPPPGPLLRIAPERVLWWRAEPL